MNGVIVSSCSRQVDVRVVGRVAFVALVFQLDGRYIVLVLFVPYLFQITN